MDYFAASLRVALRLLLSGDNEVWRIIPTSLAISGTVVLLAALVAVPLGGVIGMAEFAGKRFLSQLLASLVALPTVVVGLLLYGLLSPLLVHLVSTAVQTIRKWG